MTRKFKAILFDLDGTLVDTLEDLANATNWAMQQLDCPTHPLDLYRFFVGDGANTLCARALPSNRQGLRQKAVELMRDHYHKHCFDKTTIYPGILELLKTLKANKVTLCILSNKPDDFTKRIVAHYFPDDLFQVVRGHLPEELLKPDPATALQIAEILQLFPAEFIYVGDTRTDMETANAAGMYAIGVLWGFRDQEELSLAGAQQIVHAPSEILPLVKLIH